MTTEEKAKAYDEAMNKIKPLYEQAKRDGNPIWSTYEYLIPELSASEDERMMKNIRLAILSVEDAFWRTHGLTAKEAISYIEKQKDFAADEYWRGFKNGRDEVIESPGAFNLQEKQKEQKPAEWSEDDKNMWTHLNGYLNGFSCSEDAIKQMADWFYELPNRFNLQPKQEWSEEDERIIKDAIYALEEVGGYPYTVKGLKSLRPQPHWKPSEEEIESVKYFVNKHQSEAWAATGQWKQFTALRGLLGNLMKLM